MRRQSVIFALLVAVAGVVWWLEIGKGIETNCLIKGDISGISGERIFYAPGDSYYEQTVIDPASGEQWFCSELEAQAAGWRRTKVIGLAQSSPSLTIAAKVASSLKGRASVIDGDTIEIHGTRIRLHGIDAPESGQSCIANGRQYRCGQRAAFALSDKIGSSTVSCEPNDRDRYGRIVATCRSRGTNLNAWMVSQGWAVAYRHFSRDYIRQEKQATAAKRGIWQGQFVDPWDWRRGKRLAANGNKKARTHCRIKGNISRRGERIYHVPGGQYYSRTRITPSKGERWFCSEAEARAAGWRRSKR